MPAGPFSSSVGVGRAEPEWAALNRVSGTVGKDSTFEGGTTCEAPAPLPEEVMSGDLSTAPRRVDLLIVGAGLSGAVLAERSSRELGLSSIVIDVRNHIGGNCYDYITEHGLRASKYGAHLFHTNSERVWEYVTRFSEWIPFDHRVRGRVLGDDGIERLVPIPPTQETVNALFGTRIESEEQMQRWYDENRVQPPQEIAANGEEAAIGRVGPQLYERVFKHYTKKQWDKYPSELDASVLMRLPCRVSTDDRYFGDAWQALPKRGYTRMFENMLLRDPNITLRLNCDFFAARDAGALPSHSILVYTGPIDGYFAQQGMPRLEYRSLRFQEEHVEEPDGGFFQEAMVVNYPSPEVPFTRIVEYKHAPNQPEAVRRGDVKGSLVVRETSSAEGDPYYPVPNAQNRELYEKYRALAEAEDRVLFVGRLASYKYFNMDQAILNALEMFDSLREAGKLPSYGRES